MDSSKYAKDAKSKKTVEAKSKDLPDKLKKEDSSDSSSKLIDRRIFAADESVTLTAKEEAEFKEFHVQLKKYNVLAKKMRKEALKKERQELNDEEKSPKMRYYEGTRAQRIESLDMQAKLMDEMEKRMTAGA